jgi:cobalamin biosynthesis protein CobD/CbiB
MMGQDHHMTDPWLPASLTPELARLTGPLSIIIFILIVDAVSRLVPAIRDHARPLLGIPQGLFKNLQQKLARPSRSSVELQRRGVFTVIVVVAMAALLAWVGQKFIMHVRHGVYVAWFLVWQWSAGWTIARQLLAWDKPHPDDYKALTIRHRLQAFTPLPARADAASLYRNSIEILAVSLVHGLCAPLTYALLAASLGYPAFYGAVFGMLGTILVEQRAIDATQRQFQQAACAIGSGILFLPSRLAGILVVLATLFTPKANSIKAFTLMVREGHRYGQLSLGWVMAAISGAFGIAFALPEGEWMGPDNSTARIERTALLRALWLHVVTIMVVLLVLCAVLLLSV